MPAAVGNVARNIAAPGGAWPGLGRRGRRDDAAGAELTALIAAEAGIEDVLVRPAGAATIVKTRFVSSGQQLLRLGRRGDAGCRSKIRAPFPMLVSIFCRTMRRASSATPLIAAGP